MPNSVFTKPLIDNPEYQPLLEGAPQTCGMRAGRVYLAPGQSCGQHSTKQHEEMLVFLQGQGIALVGPDSKSTPVAAKHILYIPPHTLHDIQNHGSEALIYIYCVAPAGEE